MAKKKTPSSKTVNPYRNILKGKTVAISGKPKPKASGLEIAEKIREFVRIQGGKMKTKVDADLDILIAAKASDPKVKLAKKLNAAGEANIEIVIGNYDPLFPELRERLVNDILDPKLCQKMVQLVYEFRSFWYDNPLLVKNHDFSNKKIGFLKSNYTLLSEINFEDCKFNKTQFQNFDFGFGGIDFKNCQITKATLDDLRIPPENCVVKDCQGKQLVLFGPRKSKFEKLKLGKIQFNADWLRTRIHYPQVDQCDFKNCQFDKTEFEDNEGVIKSSTFETCTFANFTYDGPRKETTTIKFVDCRFKSVTFDKGIVEHLVIEKCNLESWKAIGIKFESLALPKSKFNNCEFVGLRGNVLDLRGCQLKNCTITDCEIGLIRIDDKQRQELKGIDEIKGVTSFENYSKVAQLAETIKKASSVNIELEGTAKKSKTDTIKIEIQKKKSVRFARTFVTTGRSLMGHKNADPKML